MVGQVDRDPTAHSEEEPLSDGPDIELVDSDPESLEEEFGARTEIGFLPAEGLVVVHTPPPDRESESGLDLSPAESLDAGLPNRGTVVATGRFSRYDLGDEVLVRKYTGVQMEVDGDDNYWILNEHNNEILGRFDTPSPATLEE